MLSIVTLNEAEKWDKIVKSFRNYDVYYLSGYSKAFQIHGDGEPMLFYYEDKNIRGMNVVMKRDIAEDENFAGKLPKGLYYDLATPYGYGGLLIEGKATENDLRRLNIEYTNLCRSKGIICEFVRFHPLLQNDADLGCIYDISKLGKTISMNLESREHIWNNLTSTNRNKIRKAKKSGVEVFWGRSAELYTEFVKLYNQTMNKVHARKYYYFEEEFYKSILNDLKYNTLMFYAVYQRQIISMAIILFANHQMHYHLSGSDKKYQNLAPTNLLLYEAACWGCENGYKTFHLGGGLGSREDSLYKFKSAFNKKSFNIFKVGRKIFDYDKYEKLIDIRKTEALRVNNTNTDFESRVDMITDYFPKYRAEFFVTNDGKHRNEGI